MKRFSYKTKDFQDTPKVDTFLSDIKNVCIKHGMSISHEDGHGSFIIQGMIDGNMEWLLAAIDDTK